MRCIRFTPAMVETIRAGKKVLTFRKAKRPLGIYIVEEGGRSWYDHADTGLRIEITETCAISDVRAYVQNFFREEGFDSPEDFLKCLLELYKGKLPRYGVTHRFTVMK